MEYLDILDEKGNKTVEKKPRKEVVNQLSEERLYAW